MNLWIIFDTVFIKMPHHLSASLLFKTLSQFRLFNSFSIWFIFSLGIPDGTWLWFSLKENLCRCFLVSFLIIRIILWSHKPVNSVRFSSLAGMTSFLRLDWLVVGGAYQLKQWLKCDNGPEWWRLVWSRDAKHFFLDQSPLTTTITKNLKQDWVNFVSVGHWWESWRLELNTV